MKRKPSETAMMMPLIACFLCSVATIASKACGIMPGVSWAQTGLVAAALSLPVIIFIAILLLTIFSRLRQQMRIIRALQCAINSATLNAIGPIFGQKRKTGESNGKYKRRILKAAAHCEGVHLYRENAPKPATGERLDAIAGKYGLARYKGESDKHLQERVREEVERELTEQSSKK